MSKQIKVRRNKKRSNNPYKGVVCGIDPGKISGFSIWFKGELILSKVLSSARDIDVGICSACAIACNRNVPILFIAETLTAPFLPNRQRMSHASILGIGMSWGRWQQEIDKIDIQKTVIRITTREWRARYGLNGMPKEQAKRMALAIASKEAKDQITDHNEAEAILIGKVGCYLDIK